MKYIIDVPDSFVDSTNGLHIPIDKTGNFRIDTGLKLTPYTEPDRKAIEDEAWNLAREIAYCMSVQECIDTGMLHDDDIYDSASGVLEKLTYQEAKEKYEAWKKQKDEIRVGDEIYSDGDFENSIVMETYGDGSVSVYTKSGCIEHWYNKVHNLKKTGRHFDEVEELLKKMRDTDED